ncbi:MAG TPA: GntR family transcriptional regulator [Solirubrobacteraceae bacterium]|jgi:DNA-binding GntR family transcriptional regulator|nr:GntR family transcriptional regulator [Solirubrobacteraceae bacterium]
MSAGSGPRAPRLTARDLVAGHLRSQILAGELKPGDRLLIPDIADRMGVSQTPTRAALQQLEAEGLVSSNAYRGSWVAELDVNEGEEIYAMRAALERIAARDGTLKIDANGIAEMERLLGLLSDAAEAHDIVNFIELDREFHRVHYQASGRERLWERIIALRYAAERYTRLTYEDLPHEMTDGIPRHAELLDLIRARDADGAAAWVDETMTRVMDNVRALFNTETGPTESSNRSVGATR